jgi:hypothetical protein
LGRATTLGCVSHNHARNRTSCFGGRVWRCCCCCCRGCDDWTRIESNFSGIHGRNSIWTFFLELHHATVRFP